MNPSHQQLVSRYYSSALVMGWKDKGTAVDGMCVWKHLGVNENNFLKDFDYHS